MYTRWWRNWCRQCRQILSRPPKNKVAGSDPEDLQTLCPDGKLHSRQQQKLRSATLQVQHWTVYPPPLRLPPTFPPPRAIAWTTKITTQNKQKVPSIWSQLLLWPGPDRPPPLHFNPLALHQISASARFLESRLDVTAFLPTTSTPCTLASKIQGFYCDEFCVGSTAKHFV